MFSKNSIVYTQEQLLALQNSAVLPEERPETPLELKIRKRCGSHAWKERRARKQYSPVLPYIIMGNIRSLYNKMDELAVLTKHQREYQECSIMQIIHD